jgi:hypothetical protein
LGPVGIGAQAWVDGVDEIVPPGGVGTAPPNAGGGVALQQGLHGAGAHRVLACAGEAGVSLFDTGGGAEHRDLGGQSRIDRD